MDVKSSKSLRLLYSGIERPLSTVAIVSSTANSVNSSITYKLKVAINIHRLALFMIGVMLIFIDAK